MADVGGLVRRFRQRAGLSQSDLGGDDFSASYVSLIEAGKRHPSDEALAVFARRLGCSVDDLRDTSADETGTAVELELSYARLALANGEAAAARTRLELLLRRPALALAQEHEVLLLLAEVHEKENDLDAAVQILKPLYELCLAGRSPLALTAVANALSWCCVNAGDLQAAVRVGEQALAASTEAGLGGTADHLRLHATVMGVYLELGDNTFAMAAAHELLERARSAGSSFAEAAAYWNAAMVAESRGRTHEALRMSQRALGLMGEQGSSRNLAQLQFTAAELLLLGDPERAWQAAEILDRSLPTLADLGSPGDQATWEGIRAVAHLLTGDARAAERFARRALVHLEDAGDLGQSAQVTITLADALVAQGRHDEARTCYREALGLVPQERRGWRAAGMYRSLAYRFRLLDDEAAASDCLERALEVRGVTVHAAAADVAFGLRGPVPAPAETGTQPSAQPGTDPGSEPLTMGTRTALPHSVHEPS
jgi:tetratricopeptide (TPR) repeat protein